MLVKFSAAECGFGSAYAINSDLVQSVSDVGDGQCSVQIQGLKVVIPLMMTVDEAVNRLNGTQSGTGPRPSYSAQ